VTLQEIFIKILLFKNYWGITATFKKLFLINLLSYTSIKRETATQPGTLLYARITGDLNNLD
jgi:hypothetical protein